MASTPANGASLPKTQAQWKAALDSLPDNPARIPAFFFGHGSPMLAFSEEQLGIRNDSIMRHAGPKGPLAMFLRDFGPALLAKYKPKAIVVFSAHWETHGERQVTDYGDQNPLYYDYYGFPPSLYQLKFNSRGDTKLAEHIVDIFKAAGMRARTTSKLEPRGLDGLGKNAPGFDHGVFVPFRLMFGETYTDIPIVEVSMDSTLDPAANWAVGKAVQGLRDEQILILSGGLTIHNLRDFSCFSEEDAKPAYREFDKAVLDAVAIPEFEKRKTDMINLTKHKWFRAAHPREDHFVPLYIAAGAAEDGDVRIVSAIYGSPTVAFGV